MSPTVTRAASPWPPPPHRAAAPRPPPPRRSSSTRVITRRVPDMPMGWPRAMAPPLTLTTSSAMPRSAMDAADTAANASLISNRSTSVTVRPVRVEGLRDGPRRLGEQRRVGPGDQPEADQLGQGGQAQLLGLGPADDHHGRRPVGDLGRVAGGDGAVGREGRACSRPRAVDGGVGADALVGVDDDLVLALADRARGRSRPPAGRPWWRCTPARGSWPPARPAGPGRSPAALA